METAKVRYCGDWPWNELETCGRFVVEVEVPVEEVVSKYYQQNSGCDER